MSTIQDRAKVYADTIPEEEMLGLSNYSYEQVKAAYIAGASESPSKGIKLVCAECGSSDFKKTEEMEYDDGADEPNTSNKLVKIEYWHCGKCSQEITGLKCDKVWLDESPESDPSNPVVDERDKRIEGIEIEQARSFSESDIGKLQSKVHAITGDGEVMKLFNALLGVAAK